MIVTLYSTDLLMTKFEFFHRQNMEITRKYENTMKEVDYYRKQERAAYTALQNLRMQYEEVRQYLTLCVFELLWLSNVR